MEINYNNFEAVKKVFSKEGVVVLNHFFSDESLKKLKNEIKKLKFKKDFELLHHSYQKAKININLREFLSKIINKKVKNLQFTVLKLTWKDYIILNDKYIQKPGTDIIIDLTKEWGSNCGGLITYVDGSGDYLQIPASENSLAIVRRKKGTNKFIQYINYHGEGKERIILIGKL